MSFNLCVHTRLFWARVQWCIIMTSPVGIHRRLLCFYDWMQSYVISQTSWGTIGEKVLHSETKCIACITFIADSCFYRWREQWKNNHCYISAAQWKYVNKAFTGFKKSGFEKVASGGSSTLTSFLSLLHLQVASWWTQTCECVCAYLYSCTNVCVYPYLCMSVCVGVLEPKFSMCQMMWQQWTRQCEALFFYLTQGISSG